VFLILLLALDEGGFFVSVVVVVVALLFFFHHYFLCGSRIRIGHARDSNGSWVGYFFCCFDIIFSLLLLTLL